MKLSLESKRAKDPKQKTEKYYRIFVCNYFKLNCMAGCNYGVYLFTKGLGKQTYVVIVELKFCQYQRHLDFPMVVYDIIYFLYWSDCYRLISKYYSIYLSLTYHFPFIKEPLKAS